MEGLDKINLLTGRSSAIFLVVLNEIAFVYLQFSGLRVKYDVRDGTFTLKHHLKIFHSFTLTIPVLQAQRRVRFLIGYYSLCNMLYIELPCFIILLLVCTIRCLSALAHACEEFRRRRLLKYSLANFRRSLLNQGGRCIKHKVTILGTCVIDQRAIS